ncbi:cyclin domain-containing protein [Blastomyces gilchristii SLH14081]|uniref:Cyclin domain-containing protein n=1 Tax=Blastomyces gilchristii (strain SLH14081) TaxID=559298 RepID=A0A179UKL9_BLAGS|nr:cyclin domain-containing protein [Blastomyces gilchristii SLH14081]OAT07697.1 cyclin domain-containing protein [Blastomyces gilchristii SLH14081]
MAPAASLDNLSNPLVTAAQLATSSSSLDGVTIDLETSVRYAGVRLTQAAGILLQLPQDVIAKAIVVFTRFWVGPEGGSLAVYSAKDISAASLYLMAKLSFTPISPRSIINVFAFLLSPEASPLDFTNPHPPSGKPIPEAYYVSEGSYQAERLALMKMEATVLRTLAFNTHVTLPHTIALTYLQTLGASSAAVSKRVFQHLNAALLSPQLLYLTHQPNALAVSAIYLAAREEGVKLVDDEWWEVFDVDREELGFLVVGMRSMENFATAEKEKWKGRRVPLTVDQLEAEQETRKMLEEGE